MSKITIDTLAGMMNKSFEHLEKKIDDVKDELKEDIKKLDTRMDKLENGQERRITKLEDDMRVVKTALGK
jgi:hypothetical protein